MVQTDASCVGLDFVQAKINEDEKHLVLHLSLKLLPAFKLLCHSQYGTVASGNCITIGYMTIDKSSVVGTLENG